MRCVKKKVNGVWMVYVHFHQPGIVTFIMDEIPFSPPPGFPPPGHVSEGPPQTG